MGTLTLAQPSWNVGLLGGLTTTTAVLDAANEKVAVVCRAFKTGNISTIRGQCTAVNVGGGNPVYDVRVETVSASTGDPTGTLWGTNTNATLTVTATGHWSVTLTSDAAVTAGDIFAVVVNATTVGATQQATFTVAHGTTWNSMFPYAMSDTGGGYSRTTNLPCGQLAVYSDGTPVTGVSLDAYAEETYNSGSTPDERGNLWTFDQTCSIGGIGAIIRPGAGSTYDLVMADASGTELAKLSFDGDQQRSTSATGLVIGRFESAVTVAGGSTFHLFLRPNTATSHRLAVHTFASSSDRSLLEANAYYASRTDNGAISTDATKLACIWPLVEVTKITPSFASFG